MKLHQILIQIEKMKLEEPSSAIIEVRAGDLETLYTAIRALEADIEYLDNAAEATAVFVQTQQDQIKLLNSMVKANKPGKSLDSFA